jgi:hypothetical protein
MGSENLKNALRDAVLTPEEFADILKVDPKTVQRWLAGTTTPYPRHRTAIARALNLAEHELWPDHVRPPPSDPGDLARPVVGDVVASWSRVDDPTAPSYVTFLAQATHQLDLLDTGGHLPEELIEVLDVRARDGCHVRVLTHATADTLRQIDDLSRVAVRISASLSMPPLMRTDQEMLLAIPLSGSEPPALLQLARRTADGMFNRLEQEFQALWEAAEIYNEPEEQAAAHRHGNDHPKTGSREPASTTAQTEEQPGTVTPSEGDLRRWPRSPR